MKKTKKLRKQISDGREKNILFSKIMKEGKRVSEEWRVLQVRKEVSFRVSDF